MVMAMVVEGGGGDCDGGGGCGADDVGNVRK